jgi:hypothetical protein
LPAAIPLNAMTCNLARLIGPAIGGMLLAWVGPGACYLLNGLSFFALIFAGLAIRADLKATRREPQPVMDLVLEGALYTFRRVDLRTLFILEAIASVFGLFYVTQIPAIAEDMLKLGKNLGFCYAAVGVGSVIGLVVVTSLSHLPMKANLIRISMTLMGARLVLLGLIHSALAAYPLFALLGMCAVSHFNLTNTLFQLLSPERLRGRVLSMHIWALSGLSPFGVYAFGFLAQKAGLPITLEVGGGCVLAGATFAWLYRAGLADVA